MRRNITRASVALLAATLAVAACGDADDGEATAIDTTTTTAAATTTTGAVDGTTTTEAAGGDVAAGDFCEAAPAVDVALASEDPDPAVVQRALDDVQASAPAQLQDQVQTLVDAINELFETEDFMVFLRDDVQDANVAVNEHLVEECDFNELDITAVDYEFEDVPDTFERGAAAVFLRNEGQEFHEAVFFRIADDETRPIEELLELPEEEAMQVTQFVGAAFAGPGANGATSVQFDEPGRYAMLCFIPVGTTAEAMAEMSPDQEPEGPPHFTQGMWREFTID
jgi:uncharacterized cupredoxin-like copper-binding protein